MTNLPRDSATEAQKRYASVLHWSTLAGFVTLVVTFLLYVTGFATPMVPLEQLPRLWKLSTEDFAQATGIPRDWNWVLNLDKGDFLSLLGVGILSACSIFSISSVIPVYLRDKNRIYAAISIATLVILLFSASGMVSMHHR